MDDRLSDIIKLLPIFILQNDDYSNITIDFKDSIYL